MKVKKGDDEYWREGKKEGRETLWEEENGERKRDTKCVNEKGEIMS